MFDRELWNRYYTSTPNWPCPKCSDGRLKEVKGSLIIKETDWSKEGHSHEAWEYDWITNRYSQYLSCSDAKCGELCVLIGSSSVELEYSYDEQGRPERESINIFIPEFIHPSPALISLPKETPDKIKQEIDNASSLFWTDTSSSANKLRLTAECILTILKVKKTELSKKLKANGRRRRRNLTLKERIDILKTKKPELATLLNSIRILGNHGSHETELDVSRDDLINAFEIMEHVIETAFSTKQKRIKKAAKNIADRKGRPAKNRRRGR